MISQLQAVLGVSLEESKREKAWFIYRAAGCELNLT